MIRILCGLLIAWNTAAFCVIANAQSLSEQLMAEAPLILAKDAREKGQAIRGAILFPQKKLNCATCHAPGARDLGPDLTQLGKDVEDVFFVDSILRPSKVIKKGFESVKVLTADGKIIVGRIVTDEGDQVVLRDHVDARRFTTLARDEIERIMPNEKSTMPEGLADQLENRQQFLDIVKYLMDIAATGSPATKATHGQGGGEVDRQIRGIALLDEFNCTACHESNAKQIIPKQTAPNLAAVTSRINPHYIQRFLLNPQHVKPGTRMPDVMSNLADDAKADAAEAITHYLISLTDETYTRQKLDEESATRGQEVFHSVGCAACHSPRNDDGQETMADQSVPLGDISNKYNLDGLTAFLEDPHSVRPSGRMPNMKLTHWEAIDLANYLLADANVDDQGITANELLAKSGERLFKSFRCDRCHRQPSEPTESTGRLAELNPSKGCLSTRRGTWPYYSLNASQHAAITTAIQRQGDALNDQQQIALTMQTFRCFNCHQRDEIGGVSGARDIHFHTANENLGPQGRIPPTLTGVGTKLKRDWLRQVLVSGRSIRPYMKTRMPQYGAENVQHLPELFERVDTPRAIEHGHFDDEKEAKKVGTELVGSGGLNCVACHTFQQKPALTMPGVDLTEMAERLHKDWFYHYMQAPQSLSPNTVMPTFWPGGKAIRQDILAGVPNQQIEAIWIYLQDGRQVRTPRGLTREPIELLATERAVMLRRSYQGIGKRGIGVGYPLGVNLAFDAEQMRIAMLWKGKFAEASGVWRSQGHGNVRPLGTDLIRFAAGPELDDVQSPWVVDDGRPPHHQFRGYYLDDLDRPTFRYQFKDIEVEDYCVDVREEQSQLNRTVTFTCKQPRNGVVFRAGTHETIIAEDDRTFRLGDNLRIRIDGQHAATIVDAAEGKQLVIALKLPTGKSTLFLQYAW